MTWRLDCSPGARRLVDAWKRNDPSEPFWLAPFKFTGATNDHGMVRQAVNVEIVARPRFVARLLDDSAQLESLPNEPFDRRTLGLGRLAQSDESGVLAAAL